MTVGTKMQETISSCESTLANLHSFALETQDLTASKSSKTFPTSNSKSCKIYRHDYNISSSKNHNTNNNKEQHLTVNWMTARCFLLEHNLPVFYFLMNFRDHRANLTVYFTYLSGSL